MPKIEDLIAKCKDEEMFTQMLQENTKSMEINGKNGQVTFLTDPQIVMDALQGKERVGVVIWFPSDVFER
jgi:hypothetical protein